MNTLIFYATYRRVQKIIFCTFRNISIYGVKDTQLKILFSFVQHAGSRNMKIMKEDWVFEVWNLSKRDDDSYTTEEFYRKYKLPIFYNLSVTSTGISEADKIEIIKLITDNGGTYSGSFKVTFKISFLFLKQENFEIFSLHYRAKRPTF